MNIRVNIKEAKQEVINTVRAYLKKDETGAYEIPPERQRPILLMGPPGIGKTAIMEQVARECGISLISYTITHHTRQSAIGLPFISKKEYGGDWMRSTASRRRWPLPCCSFCSTRCSETTRCRMASSS